MEKDKKEEGRRKTNSVLAFSSIGFQMLATILIFYYIGTKLDERQEGGVGHWTLILTMIGLAISLYFMIKGLISITR